MTDYKTIRGKKVKFFTSDLSGGEAEGQLFFQDTAREMKVAVASAAWSSGAPLNTARFNGDSGQTPVTAAIYFGGGAPPKNDTEEYDGSGWSSGGDMNTGRTQLHGFGTQTTAVGSAGYVDGSGDVANVEEYNGSSWTEVTNTPASRRGGASFGTLTAGVIVGGHPNLNTTLEYDGTNWTSGGNIGTGMDRTEGAGAGTLTAGLVVAGDTTESFTYDGSTWTDVGTSNNTHDGGVDMGIQTSAVIATGFGAPGSGVVTTTELYDGTSFSSSTAVSTGRYGSGKGGVASTAAFIAGGDQNPGTVSITEEFNITVNTVTASAWSSGGNMNTARRAMSGGAGTATAGLVAGGYISDFSNATEEYDGSSWTAGGNYPASKYYAMIAGTQTAGLGVGGGDPVVAETCEYNGSTWTDVGNAPESRKMMGRSGTQTAALFAGGNDGPNAAVAEAFTYDGSSFTNITDLPSNRGSGHVSGGSQTATVHAAGSLGPPGYTDTTVEWNGSAWGAGGTHLFSGQSHMNSNNTSGYNNSSAGGYGTSAAPSGITGVGCSYDGTSWFTTAPLSTARQQGSGFGGVDDFVVCAGTTGSATAATEEFAAETTSLNLKTITDS